MAINDAFMLPKRVRTMEQMEDLLAVEQAELSQIQRVIAALEKQLTISTSTYLISRHERLFALPVKPAESLDIRRAVVLAKLNARGTTTVRVIRDLVKIVTGREGVVEESFSQYTFSVRIELSAGSTAAHAQELIRQIEQIKPAHLLLEAIIILPQFSTTVPIRAALGPRMACGAPPMYHAPPPAGRIYAAHCLGTRYSTNTPPMAAQEGGNP